MVQLKISEEVFKVVDVRSGLEVLSRSVSESLTPLYYKKKTLKGETSS
jgi:hypothetical protein